MPKEWLSRVGPPAQDSGVGLAGMRERLNQLKGGLEIEPADPGTRLRAIVPLVAERHRLASVRFQRHGYTALPEKPKVRENFRWTGLGQKT